MNPRDTAPAAPRPTATTDRGTPEDPLDLLCVGVGPVSYTHLRAHETLS